MNIYFRVINKAVLKLMAVQDQLARLFGQQG